MLKSFYMVSCLMFSGSMVWASSTQESSQEKTTKSIMSTNYRFPKDVIQIMAGYVGELFFNVPSTTIKLPPLDGSVGFSNLTWAPQDRSICIKQWFTPEDRVSFYTMLRSVTVQFPSKKIGSLISLKKTEAQYGRADQLNDLLKEKNKALMGLSVALESSVLDENDYALSRKKKLALVDNAGNLSIYNPSKFLFMYPEEVLDEQFAYPVVPCVKRPGNGTRKAPAAKRQKSLLSHKTH